MGWWGAALALLAATAAVAQAKPVVTAADTLRVRGYEQILADPKWEGRGIGTAGIDSAANWIAARMKSFGLAPGGDTGGYLQSFDVTTGALAQEPCVLEWGGKRFPLGDSLQPIGFSTNGIARARVVFAGYGITAPGQQYDDYAGLDAHDAIVLVLTQEPGEMDTTSRFEGSINTPYADVRTKAINAREHGAIGLLLVNGPKYHAGEPLRPPAPDGGGYMTSGLLAAQVSEAAANTLLAPTGTDLAAAQAVIEKDASPHSFALPDTVSLTVNLRRTRARTSNVIGIVAGRDTMRTLVLGAHYDHLGYGGASSLSPNEHVPHVGADDNASGVSALLAAAQRLAARAKKGWRPVHTLVFVAFTGEEIGLVGSSHFTDDPPRKLETIETMINMDMVGRLRGDKLQVMGAGTAAEFHPLVTAVNAAVPQAHFEIHTSEDGFGPSDHSSFYKRGVPVLMLFTGSHPDYHKPSDTWDKINNTGLVRVSYFAQALLESLDARPKATLTKAKADASPGRIAGGGGYGAYLGTIPDYMQTEGGVLLSGVRDGSPAEKAGLKGNDVIVRFDGIRVDNIYDYTFALRSRKPGQDVRITVKRDGKEVDLVATLGRRP
jgi:Zn-dependent M28 family amino/carboxypeptidase